MEKEVHHQVSTLDKKLGDSASMEKKKKGDTELEEEQEREVEL